MTRKMIAALQVSLDGFTQGPDRGEPPWVESWTESLDLIGDVDAFVQGAGMYPGYGDYWSAILEHPTSVPPYQSRVPTAREVAYARFAEKTPHYVVSQTQERVAWPPSARIVRDLAELRALKLLPGGNIYVVGGATLVRSLLSEGLLDELRLIVHPILLGGGKALFGELDQRRALSLVHAEIGTAGKVILSYRT
jgi:dihydrofolate reductase